THPAAGAPTAARVPAAARAPAAHRHEVRGGERGRLLTAPLAPLLPGRLLPGHGPLAATIRRQPRSLQQQNPASVAAGAAGAGFASLPVSAHRAGTSVWRLCSSFSSV
uniref:Uncharacterized protein n=1 Tax=Nannospalax galili TaxID=1026970 RepID=A0A8C6WBS7_NANGA